MLSLTLDIDSLATRSGDSPYAIWGYMVTEHELQCFLYNQGTIVPYHLLATIAAAQDPSAFVARNYLHQSYQHPYVLVSFRLRGMSKITGLTNNSAAYGTHANPIQGPYPFNVCAFSCRKFLLQLRLVFRSCLRCLQALKAGKIAR